MTELNYTEDRMIQKVIWEQLRALSSLDGDRALQRLTQARRSGGGPRFLRSIANAYPQLVRAWKAQFGELQAVDGAYAMPVRVTAWDQTTIEVIYLVERQRDGTWLIDGCVCRPEEGERTYLN